jgi:hypothetical protein
MSRNECAAVPGSFEGISEGCDARLKDDRSTGHLANDEAQPRLRDARTLQLKPSVRAVTHSSSPHCIYVFFLVQRHTLTCNGIPVCSACDSSPRLSVNCRTSWTVSMSRVIVAVCGL